MGDKIKRPEMGGARSTHNTERGDAKSVLVWRSEGKKPLRRLGAEGMIILKWIFKKRDGKTWTRSFWLRTGTGGGRL